MVFLSHRGSLLAQPPGSSGQTPPPVPHANPLKINARRFDWDDEE